MRRPLFLLITILLAFVPSQARAQDPQPPTTADTKSTTDNKPWLGSARFGIDPTVIQPGSHVFFADPKTEGEIEIFKDGKLAVDLQLFGVDFVHYRPEGKARVGGNVGLGITQLDDASVLLLGSSLFFQVGQYYRIDIGFMRGISAKEGLDPSQKDRTAWFVGVSFPTKLNEGLKNLLQGKD